ncbi:hypothetical protein INR49_015739 [Caranx melampygus]|nr:hypothetical protein INR49_015739 [Caranx melampygus]
MGITTRRDCGHTWFWRTAEDRHGKRAAKSEGTQPRERVWHPKHHPVALVGGWGGGEKKGGEGRAKMRLFCFSYEELTAGGRKPNDDDGGQQSSLQAGEVGTLSARLSGRARATHHANGEDFSEETFWRRKAARSLSQIGAAAVQMGDKECLYRQLGVREVEEEEEEEEEEDEDEGCYSSRKLSLLNRINLKPEVTK